MSRTIDIPLASSNHRLFSRFAEWLEPPKRALDSEECMNEEAMSEELMSEELIDGVNVDSERLSVFRLHRAERLRCRVQAGSILIFGTGGDALQCRALPAVHDYRAFRCEAAGTLSIRENVWVAMSSGVEFEAIPEIQIRDLQEIFATVLRPVSKLQMPEVGAPVWQYKPLPKVPSDQKPS